MTEGARVVHVTFILLSADLDELALECVVEIFVCGFYQKLS